MSISEFEDENEWNTAVEIDEFKYTFRNKTISDSEFSPEVITCEERNL